jgi:hypothetical protein
LDDLRVSEFTDRLVGSIVSHFSPQSIILTGSFGRGEMSVISHGDGLKFLSDCELQVVPKWPISQEALRKILLPLSRENGIKIVVQSSLILYLYSHFNLPSRFSRMVWKPSISRYELKHGSKVVYGDNVLDRIPEIRPEDIPLWEGIKLILNRMAEALKYSPVDGKVADNPESIYAIYKIILACQDALLISICRYHYSYRVRSGLFQKLFRQEFPELSTDLPEILPLALRAAAYKIKPRNDIGSLDTTELWFVTANICNQVFRYTIGKEMGLKFATYTDFQERYMAHPGIRRKYPTGILSMPPVVQNALTLVRIISHGSNRLPRFKLVGRLTYPWRHIIYSVVPLVYFSLSQEGSVDTKQLYDVRETVSLFKKLMPPRSSQLGEWEYLSTQVFSLWHTLCG